MENIENDIHPVIKNWDLDEEQEKKEIVRHYRALLKILKSKLKKGDKELLRAAFEMAANAHKTMRRKSGEPYILHPIAVAMICVDEIGLGVRSTICALLHDTVEDTDVSLDDIKNEFGNEIDPRKELIDKILEYKRFKESAEDMKMMEAERLLQFKRGNMLKELADIGETMSEGTEIQSVTLFKLFQNYEKVMKRMQVWSKGIIMRPLHCLKIFRVTHPHF